MTILSVLIATTPDRESMFRPLFNELHRQATYMSTFHPSLGEIEIIVDDSKRFLEGGLSIGAKRDALLRRSNGKYVCYLDSDDSIAGNYLETLVRLCHKDADVCTFKNISMLKDYWCIIDMSINYPNDQASPDFVVRRKPWHICPVRSVFAKLHSFTDTNYGEDWAWFEQVLSHCKTEAKTEAVIHKYSHGDHSESDKIMKSIGKDTSKLISL